MRVLVCGGRRYDNAELVFFTLDEIHADNPITLIVEGGALGADMLAAMWANSRNVFNKTFKAEWDKYGKAAGHIRNQLMLDRTEPELVVAFSGGKGTADMCRRAVSASIPLLRVE